jgi:hypothetical protein
VVALRRPLSWATRRLAGRFRRDRLLRVTLAARVLLSGTVARRDALWGEMPSPEPTARSPRESAAPSGLIRPAEAHLIDAHKYSF